MAGSVHEQRALPRHLPEENEENHEILGQDSRGHGLDSNWALQRYRPQTLPVEPAFSVKTGPNVLGRGGSKIEVMCVSLKARVADRLYTLGLEVQALLMH